ncbi:hypothetical protein [Methanobacterium petrolearium]
MTWITQLRVLPKVRSSQRGVVYCVCPSTIYMPSSTMAVILSGKLSDL